MRHDSIHRDPGPSGLSPKKPSTCSAQPAPRQAVPPVTSFVIPTNGIACPIYARSIVYFIRKLAPALTASATPSPKAWRPAPKSSPTPSPKAKFQPATASSSPSNTRQDDIRYVTDLLEQFNLDEICRVARILQRAATPAERLNILAKYEHVLNKLI
ncbi:hypothetical protein ACJJTC_014097 [Scirpophaga incertulas]